MKKLIVLLFVLLPFVGCEKECPVCPEPDEELCWECITRMSERYYYCSGYTGPATYYYIIGSETVCGFTQAQITQREEINTSSWVKEYDCNATYPYDRIRYTREMTCTLLE
jgi:hypothetical protein